MRVSAGMIVYHLLRDMIEHAPISTSMLLMEVSLLSKAPLMKVLHSNVSFRLDILNMNHAT
jgi:hypothetical protein